MFRSRTLVASVVLLMSACGKGDLPPVGSAVAVPPPPPAPVSAAAYAIHPLDVLRIDVFGEPGLSFEELPVDTEGRIVMPMIGAVEAQNLTTLQLTDRIATQLDRYLKNPRVAVNVVNFASQKISVTGAVSRPGQYQAAGGMSLMEAIAIGGGATDTAELDDVFVFRQQGAQRYAARFDLKAVQQGRAGDPRLQSGDIVVVGYSQARLLFRDILSVLPVAGGVFVALIN